jgi:transcriptional regulator with XRE-family HTH domain
MICINLKKIRKSKRITQKELADLTCISQNYISEIENGRKAPTIKLIERVANSLEICPLELMECNCKNCKRKPQE